MPNINIKIHGIPYIVTFIIMNNKVVDPTYLMLLRCPWLLDTKLIHNWGTNMVTIEGDDTTKTISISTYLSGNIKKP